MERMSTDTTVIQDPLEAARRLGLDYGVEKFARAMHCNAQVLRNQLNPEQEQHNLGLARAMAMTDIADNDIILAAWAAHRGKVLIQIPDGSLSDDELMDDILKLDDHHGDFAKTLRAARQDGVIDPAEHRILVLLLRKIMAQAATLEHGVGSQVREVPPVATISGGGKR